MSLRDRSQPPNTNPAAVCRFETVRRAATEAGLSPGGLFLAKLLRRKALPDSHYHRHHRRRIRIHEEDRGVTQLGIHLEIRSDPRGTSVMPNDMFPIEHLVAKSVGVATNRATSIHLARENTLGVFLIE